MTVSGKSNNVENPEQTNEGPFNFVKTEETILKFWKENKIFEKSLDKTKDSPAYIFYDGPPFATGLPHHGHLVANTLKDIVPRYFTMKGRYVDRRFGWDCHGLPIEQEIDKKFEMSAADYVAKNGVKKYNDACRGIVQRYTKEWEKTVSRIGRWVDFENDYKTMDITFMESVWWVFNQAWDKGLIYEGTKVVPFSTALGTGLSNFEATSNYQEVQDPAITILFKLKDSDDHMLAWTTTPWTLPSNLALCVNEDVEYVKIKDLDLDITFYIAKERLKAYSKKRKLEELDSCKGSKLVGKKYEPLFPYFKDMADQGAFQIVSDNYVTTSDGTGIVHTAPGFGEDDNRIMREKGLKEVLVCPIDDAGKFTDEVDDYKGMYVKDTDKLIIRRLKEEGKLYDQSVVVHNYPYCPRTDTPLLYKTQPQWYLAVEKIKQSMIKANEQINWVPEHIKHGRYGKWVEGARDWAISRKRVWGTPLPIWINDETGNRKCFGSIKSLEEATSSKIIDIHRESVDDLTFTIDGEAGTYRRITDVLDCWFESGSMPYAQLHYPFENKEVFENGFPAEYIAEGLDQTRGWFYTLNVLSSMLYDKPAFKNVIVNGMVLAEDGRKMSKRLKNYTEPEILMNKFGADALRLFLINSGLVKAEELKFTDEGVKDMVRRALLPWYNSFKFFQTYAEVDNWNPNDNFKQGDNILDRWIISKLQTLITTVNTEMESYKLYNVVPALFNFIEDLTNWYIRLNRRRFWSEGLTDDKCAAYSTLYTTIKEVCTLMAPFAPFLSEHIFQELKKFGKISEESIHLCDFPEADQQMVNHLLESAVDRMQQIILLGRQKRSQVNIKVKTPIARITIIHKDQDLLDEVKKLQSYIENELNIKRSEYSIEEDKFIKLYAKPNAPVLGRRLGKKFGLFTKKISELDGNSLAKVEAGESITIDEEIFQASEILIFREPKEGTQTVSNRLISIDLDCELTDDLINEGLAREVVNRIQKTRKEQNFNVADRINVKCSGDEKLVAAIKKHSEYIMKETLSTQLDCNGKTIGEAVAFKIEKFDLKIAITLSKK